MKAYLSSPSSITNRRCARALVTGTAAAAAIVVASVSATPSSGTTSTLNGRATYGEPFKIVRSIEDQGAPPRRVWWDGHQLWWERALLARGNGQNHNRPDWFVEIKAWPAVDVAVQTITFAPGSQSGWHAHPGPVFISVVSGEVTFYDSDDPYCLPIVKKAGEGFLDTGEHAHIARNETSQPALNVVTYFAPPGAALRIDKPAPGTCGF